MRRVVRHGAPGAKVAELVDAQDLGSCGATRESSSLSFRTSPGVGDFGASVLRRTEIRQSQQKARG